MSAPTWKQALADRISPEMHHEIDTFENQLILRRQGKIDEKLFAETRLRRGVYGQRYDNGNRHDGIVSQQLNYPSNPLTKGPETLWDAPGMQRIKIPYGGLTPEQMYVLADLADEYSDSICHITTRQDFQLHYIHIEDTPAIMRRLASVGLTTREACGNAVRNITACPLAGVCHTEAFDVTPYAQATMKFLLGHQDTMDFGRKFKVAFSGCEHEACGLVAIHDLGLISVTRNIDGKPVRGFNLYVGGGLGAVPYQAKLLYEFVAEDEILPKAQAIARIFGRYGEKKNRNRARLKFVVAKFGIDEFRRLVDEERKILPHDDRWSTYIPDAHAWEERPTRPAAALNGQARPEGFDEWFKTNVYRQRQAGYCVVTVTTPLGDLSTPQMRRLAELTHQYAGDNARTTVEQNLVLRWVPEADLIPLYRELQAIGLGASGAGTIVDIVSCPGTDTCKLGIASSRGLAGELRTQLGVKSAQLDEAIQNLRIKISGCFNSCGQHHVADLGFYGNSRNIAGYTVPHFQVVLGGKWRDNGGSYGLAIGAIPSKRVPELVNNITDRYVAERTTGESFQDFCTRLGKKALKDLVDQFKNVPPHDQDESYYSDWGDPRQFTIGDMGTGECAGEIVDVSEFGFSEAEADHFESHLALEAGELAKADQFAYNAMLKAARTLVRFEYRDVPNDPQIVTNEFNTRFVETKKFFDKYHSTQFAHYLLTRTANGPVRMDKESVHTLIDEAQLFIDAAHACRIKLQAEAAASPIQLNISATPATK